MELERAVERETSYLRPTKEEKLDVFWILGEYHCRQNLENWLKYAQPNGTKIEPKYGLTLDEGASENPYTKGFLVFENGDTLISRLKEENIIIDRVIPSWQDLQGKDDFLDYVIGEQKKSRESAYVVDGKHGRITRVREFNNNIQSLSDILYSEYLPKDFLSTTEERDVDDADEGIGLKTRNAIRLALAFPGTVRTYQVKATPYGNAGMGVVAEYGADGLVRTLHFEYRPGEDLPFVDEKNQVAMFYREYGRDEAGKKICTYEAPVAM
ncbi:MAG: hypothetical protein ABIA37_03885 [Candidatus Woesearchaeota archaeon]